MRCAAQVLRSPRARAQAANALLGGRRGRLRPALNALVSTRLPQSLSLPRSLSVGPAQCNGSETSPTRRFVAVGTWSPASGPFLPSSSCRTGSAVRAGPRSPPQPSRASRYGVRDGQGALTPPPLRPQSGGGRQRVALVHGAHTSLVLGRRRRPAGLVLVSAAGEETSAKERPSSPSSASPPSSSEEPATTPALLLRRRLVLAAAEDRGEVAARRRGRRRSVARSGLRRRCSTPRRP